MTQVAGSAGRTATVLSAGWLLATSLLAASIEIGSSSPDFTLPTLEGEELTLSERRGRGPVVLIFFRGAW